MSNPTCPVCEADLSRQAILLGWCEACENDLPSDYKDKLAEVDREDFSSRVGGPIEESSRAKARAGLCDLCRQQKPDVSPCYLKVTGQSIGVTGRVKQRWLNVRCTACSSCYRDARGLQLLRYWILAFILGLPILVCGVLGLLLDPLEKAWGVPRSVTGAIALTAFGVCGLFWILGPFYVRFARRQRLANLLSDRLDQRFRDAVGVSGWGWLHYVTARSSIPEGETYRHLREI